MPALTIAATWMNAVLDGLAREGLDRSRLTADLPGIVGGRVADTARIEVDMARRVWRRAREMTHDPLLGLKVGGRLPPQATNVVNVILLHSATFGEALSHLLRYQVLLSESGRFVAQSFGGGTRLVYEPAPAAVAIDPLQIDSVTAALVAGGPRPRAVQLVGRAGMDDAAFASVLGCPVGLGASRGCVDYDAAALAAPVFGADPGLRDLNIAYAESLLDAHRRMDALCRGVRAAIARLGPRGATLEGVAREVGCAPRTLQRRLGLAGASFKSLLEAYRMGEALILLSDARASVAHVSEILGYSEPSAFSRAVTRWWGASPRELRGQNAPAAPIASG